MSDGSGPKEFFGVRLTLPQGWEDWSLYRFSAASDEPIDVLPTAARAHTVRPNVVISKRRIDRNANRELALAAVIRELAKATKQFKAGAAGSCRYLDQEVLWQDAEHVHAGTGILVAQRLLLFDAGAPNPEHGEREVVLVVMSGLRQDIARMSSEIGLAALPAP